jgi:hypothetical protein
MPGAEGKIELKNMRCMNGTQIFIGLISGLHKPSSKK